MCMQCIVDAQEIFEVMPSWYLMQSKIDDPRWPKDYFGLVQCNDPYFVWKPFYDPTIGEDENDNRISPEEDEYWKNLSEFREIINIDPRTGWYMVEAAKKVGYDPQEDGDMASWLIERITKLKAEKEILKKT